MVIFNSYVKLPEGSNHGWKILELNGALTVETASDKWSGIIRRASH